MREIVEGATAQRRNGTKAQGAGLRAQGAERRGNSGTSCHTPCNSYVCFRSLKYYIKLLIYCFT